ncbi:nuclease A inhibitor family protein [Pontibacter liquoris]|uniref:nuclease A inhibitor family protein n=1 Tax=Pontibacter liquoris TaxID=2905677 RepID=UPI001FA7E5B9|nr:nuclease A inhibitor family protein [Pontibacter liquoris]
MNKEEIQNALARATDGLLMHSEIEAPFEVVFHSLRPGQQFGPEAVAEWAGKPSGMAVETKELEQFMDEMKGISTDARQEGSMAYRYQKLVQTLHQLLRDVKVYCITQIGTEVFILGKTEAGDYAGLRTMVVHDQATIN